MKEISVNPVTPQRKAIGVSNKFGNPGLKRQQGTTRSLYDMLPLDGTTALNFFEGSNNRDFPLTNTGASGNKLTVGEMVVVERYYFSIVEIDPATGIVQAIDGLPTNNELQLGELKLEIANQTVLKPIPILSSDPQFNYSADNFVEQVFQFDTQIVLQPLLEYIWNVRLTPYTPIADTFLRLTFEGTGAIIAPRNTM